MTNAVLNIFVDTNLFIQCYSRGLSGRELLTGSSFALTSGTGEGSGAAASVWGRGTVSRFDGREGDLSLDGEVAGGCRGGAGTCTRLPPGGALVTAGRGRDTRMPGSFSGGAGGAGRARAAGVPGRPPDKRMNGDNADNTGNADNADNAGGEQDNGKVSVVGGEGLGKEPEKRTSCARSVDRWREFANALGLKRASSVRVP